ncbi:class I SAM-dependent methyltransferase [Shewanella marisflavi]|uniref:class I SAM-dependent methyltransferase n=1 Tax=Shewanella marisflavi TaxID=260364 RepID=UPI003AAEB61E
MKRASIMSQHWDEYWQQGHLTSFGASFSGNYSGVLETIWHQDFKCLPDDFKVLDLATGNGALPLLLNQFFADTQKPGEVIGVDLAKINTDLAKLDLNNNIDVSLVSHVDCASLPYANNHFDQVISQFGLEYSDLTLSIPEAIRVLKPEGALSLVTHHSRSLVINRNRRILTLISRDETQRVFATMEALVAQMGTLIDAEDLRKVKQDPECERLRHELNQHISALVQFDEDALKDSELLAYVATLFQQGLFWSLEQKTTYLNFAKTQIVTLKERLSELIAASLDESALASLLARLNEYGAVLYSLSQIANEDGQILGWKIVINKTV